MKSKSILSLLALSGLVAFAAQPADKNSDPGEPKAEKKSRIITIKRVAGHEGEGQGEKVTYLGVETGPVPRALAAHLDLERDHGLVVNSVAEESPASAVLKENDVLVKLDDQLLVDSRQLSVLVRGKKPGDEVKLTLIRAGKQHTVTAKLGERVMPRMFGAMHGPNFGEGGPDVRLFRGDGDLAIEHLRELPGIARDELKDVLRIIGNERGNWFAGPRVHVFNRRHKDGSTILNMAEGNFAFSDDEGAVEVNANNGDRKLTVKDAKGKVLFEGPINTDEQRQKLPAEVKERLKKLDAMSIDFDADENLEQEGAAVKPPQKAKTVQPTPALPASPAARPL